MPVVQGLNQFLKKQNNPKPPNKTDNATEKRNLAYNINISKLYEGQPWLVWLSGWSACLPTQTYNKSNDHNYLDKKSYIFVEFES